MTTKITQNQLAIKMADEVGGGEGPEEDGQTHLMFTYISN